LTTNPYVVPAVSAGGVLKVNAKKNPPPSEVPGEVALASKAPAVMFGTRLPPDVVVVLTSAMMFGFVPEQVAQKMYTSSFGSVPVTVGLNVWPSKAVEVKPKPAVLLSETETFRNGASSRMTLPGLVVRSVFAGTPSWKSAWVVSVRHPLLAAVVSEKFCVVVLPSVTVIGPADPVLKPGALAVMLGYVPAGIFRY